MTRLLPVVGLAGVLVAAAPAATAPNVAGTLSVARALYCHLDEPCDPPATDAWLVFSRSGRVAARKHVGSSGAFALRLAPGRYTIRVARAPVRGKLSPLTVLVPQSRSIRLHLSIAPL